MNKRFAAGVVSVLFFVLVWAAQTGFCAVPKLVAFQGRLSDSTSKAVTGTRALTFRIFNAETGGTAAWTENQDVVFDSYGMYNVYLGAVTALNLDFNDAYWLEVSVGNETLTPRYRLVPSAYSFYSIKSASATYAVSAGSADSVSWANVSGKPANISTTTFTLSADSVGGYNIAPGTITARELASGIDASGKGFDADKVDGVHSSQFLRNDAGAVVLSTHIAPGAVGAANLNPGLYNTFISTQNAYWLLLSTGGYVPSSVHNHAGLAPGAHASLHADGQADSISSYYLPKTGGLMTGGVITSSNIFVSGANSTDNAVKIGDGSGNLLLYGSSGNSFITYNNTLSIGKNGTSVSFSSGVSVGANLVVSGIISGDGSGLTNVPSTGLSASANNSFTGTNSFSKMLSVSSSVYTNAIEGGANGIKIGTDLTKYLTVHNNYGSSSDSMYLQGSLSNLYIGANNGIFLSSPTYISQTLQVLGQSTFNKMVTISSSVYITGENGSFIAAPGNTGDAPVFKLLSGGTTMFCTNSMGNVGIGTGNTSGMGITLSDINTITYRSTQTRYYSVSGALIQGLTTDVIISTGGFAYNSTASSTRYGVIGVNLPQGATITNFAAHTSITSGGGSPEVVVNLVRAMGTTEQLMTSAVHATGDARDGMLSTNKTSFNGYENVANQSYYYFVVVKLTNGDTSISKFYGATITYTVTSPLP